MTNDYYVFSVYFFSFVPINMLIMSGDHCIVNTGVESGRSSEQRGQWSRGCMCHNIVKCLLYNKQAW